jgi:hypothetical protein
MFGKIWLTSMTAATLLASPAFAGWSSGQIDAVDGQRFIGEVVVNGDLIAAESDEPPPSELRPIPDWIDHGSTIDRRAQHLW